MKKPDLKLTILLGIVCLLLLAASSWYTIAYNDSRLIGPTDISEFAFRMQDIPMLFSLLLFVLYFLYLFALLIRGIIANKRRKRLDRSPGH